ncbi:MAG: glycosyltransferase family 8 protein [Clostridia bacterium]|nr:glycosyltransferase family 8 protein [Clostridia bacterium]
MNILYCGDKNIADGLIISVLSLMKNIPEQLNIYVLTMKCSTGERDFEPLSREFAEYMDNLLKRTNPKSSLQLIDITELFQAEVPLANMDTRFTPGCMVRLFADSIDSLPDKILYLDNDVVCRGDISDFYNTDMHGAEMAGVLDYYGKWFFRRNIFKMDYLNSGVLLLNLKMIKDTALFSKARERCRTKQMFMPDQSALNKLSVSKLKFPRRYNEQRKLRDDTLLQHFTTSFRFFPWFHSVTVKPWQIDKVHTVLRLHEYDELLSRYQEVKEQYKINRTGEI